MRYGAGSASSCRSQCYKESSHNMQLRIASCVAGVILVTASLLGLILSTETLWWWGLAIGSTWVVLGATGWLMES